MRDGCDGRWKTDSQVFHHQAHMGSTPCVWSSVSSNEAGVSQVRCAEFVVEEDATAPGGFGPDRPAARALQDDCEWVGRLEAEGAGSSVS